MTDNLHEALASVTASYQIELIEVCEVGMRSFPVEMKRFLANYIYRLELQLPIDEKDAVTVTRINGKIQQSLIETELCKLDLNISPFVLCAPTLLSYWTNEEPFRLVGNSL